MWEKWNQMKLIETYLNLLSEEERIKVENYEKIAQFLFKVRDYVQAVEFLHKAIEAQQVSAYFYMGLCCKYSLGVQNQEAKAAYYFAEWMEQSSQDNMNRNHICEAYCMLCGHGQKQDTDKALKILKRSANSRNTSASILLGKLYMGDILEGIQDYQLAKYYLEIAAEQNNVDAAYELSYLYQFIENGRYIEEAQASYGYVTGQYMRVKEKYPGIESYSQLKKHYERGCVGLSREHYQRLADECQHQMESLLQQSSEEKIKMKICS